MHRSDRVYKALRNLYYQDYFSHNCKCDEVAKAAEIDVNELPKFLDRFQKLGLIRYSLDDNKNFIAFTSLGLKTTTILQDL